MEASVVAVSLATLSGESLGEVTIDPSALGRELVRQARALRGGAGVTVALLHGAMCVQEHVPVGEQGLGGARLQLVAAPVDKAAQQRVQRAVLAGVAPGDDEWQLWDAIGGLSLEKLPQAHVRQLK